jgi:hypothetical protein
MNNDTIESRISEPVFVFNRLLIFLYEIIKIKQKF